MSSFISSAKIRTALQYALQGEWYAGDVVCRIPLEWDCRREIRTGGLRGRGRGSSHTPDLKEANGLHLQNNNYRVGFARQIGSTANLSHTRFSFSIGRTVHAIL